MRRSLTPAERFALQLRECGLTTPELAQAMSWSIAETQVFLWRTKELRRAAPGTAPPVASPRRSAKC